MPSANPLRILFLVSAHNSLSQRIFIALTEQGHDVTVRWYRRGTRWRPRWPPISPS